MSFVQLGSFVPSSMQADLFAAVGVGLNVLGIPWGQNPGVEAPAIALEVVRAGTGTTAQVGDRVTIHFVVRTEEGRELANSLKRGMPYTVELDEPNGLWSTILDGLRAGGAAKLTANSNLFFGKGGIAPIVPPDTVLKAYVTLLRVEKAMIAKKAEVPAKPGQR